jgi:hypothetical protein
LMTNGVGRIQSKSVSGFEVPHYKHQAWSQRPTTAAVYRHEEAKVRWNRRPGITSAALSPWKTRRSFLVNYDLCWVPNWTTESSSRFQPPTRRAVNMSASWDSVEDKSEKFGGRGFHSEKPDPVSDFDRLFCLWWVLLILWFGLRDSVQNGISNGAALGVNMFSSPKFAAVQNWRSFFLRPKFPYHFRHLLSHIPNCY